VEGRSVCATVWSNLSPTGTASTASGCCPPRSECSNTVLHSDANICCRVASAACAPWNRAPRPDCAMRCLFLPKRARPTDRDQQSRSATTRVANRTCDLEPHTLTELASKLALHVRSPLAGAMTNVAAPPALLQCRLRKRNTQRTVHRCRASSRGGASEGASAPQRPLLAFTGGGIYYFWQVGVVIALRERLPSLKCCDMVRAF